MQDKKSTRQLTIRIPDDVFNETQREARECGASHNSYLMMLVQLGRKIYNGDCNINLGER